MRSSAGLWLIGAGIVLVLAGALAYLGWLSWFGRLPGDLRIERPNTRVYIPITSMLLLSLLLSVLMAIINRFR